LKNQSSVNHLSEWTSGGRRMIAARNSRRQCSRRNRIAGRIFNENKIGGKTMLREEDQYNFICIT